MRSYSSISSQISDTDRAELRVQLVQGRVRGHASERLVPAGHPAVEAAPALVHHGVLGERHVHVGHEADDVPAEVRRRDAEGKTYKEPTTGFTAKDTEWHRVTCFNGLGRVIAQHAVKGMLVSVKGRIHYSKWTDREGIERYGCEIIADDVQFLSRPRQPGIGGGTEPQQDLDDDVPF